MPLKEFTSKYFLGRNSELAVLANMASRAGSGDANSIILSGKRGIGKTELLRHLYNELFNSQNNTVPFFYTIKTAFASIDSFSRDYISTFILQCLAFIRKDASLINSGIYSLEDLKVMSDRSAAPWISDIIGGYSQVRQGGDLLKLFSYVISVPHHSYRHTGMPVVVMIDDFHKIRKLSELNAGGDGKDLWMLFENSIKFRYSPHVLAGFQSELHRMFFEETSFGEHLEIINLGGLDRQDSLKLFRSLCDKYALKCETDVTVFLEHFGGNPFYIKSFMQAARQTANIFSKDVFWEIYNREITKGKIYTYWTSILKSYIQRFELRKPSLNLLYNLCEKGADDLSNLAETLSIKQEDLEYILGLLHTTGVIETGFSSLAFADDLILADLIKGLYHKEILKEPMDKVNDAISGDKRRHVAPAGTPAFDIIIPKAPKTELVAVKTLEQVAKYFNVPPDVTGQLQVSLIELFYGVLAKDGASGETYQLKFNLSGNMFSIEILTSQTGLVFTDEDLRQVRHYIDDIRVEEVTDGSRIILTKELKEDFVSAP